MPDLNIEVGGRYVTKDFRKTIVIFGKSYLTGEEVFITTTNDRYNRQGQNLRSFRPEDALLCREHEAHRFILQVGRRYATDGDPRPVTIVSCTNTEIAEDEYEGIDAGCYILFTGDDDKTYTADGRAFPYPRPGYDLLIPSPPEEVVSRFCIRVGFTYTNTYGEERVCIEKQYVIDPKYFGKSTVFLGDNGVLYLEDGRVAREDASFNPWDLTE